MKIQYFLNDQTAAYTSLRAAHVDANLTVIIYMKIYGVRSKSNWVKGIVFVISLLAFNSN